MKGQETAPLNDTGLAQLLEYDSPLTVIVGKPAKNAATKAKNFSSRIQRSQRKTRG